MATTESRSFFGPVPASAAGDQALLAYLSYLERRNGTVSADGPFPLRERWLAEANGSPARFAGEADPAVFERNWARFDGAEVEDPRLAALLGFVKVNAGEAYGVEAVGRARHARPPSDAPVDRVERLLLKEEEYHTRILLGATHQFGLEPPKAAYRPPVAVKALIGALVHAPEPFFHPVLLAAEVGGLFLFNWMLGRVSEVFAHEPELRETMEERLLEIIVDELGHVTFNRIAVGGVGLASARAMAPHVAHATGGRLPELGALGWTRHALDGFAGFGPASLPEAAVRRAFVT